MHFLKKPSAAWGLSLRLAIRFLFSVRGHRLLGVLTALSLLLVVGTVAMTYALLCVAESFSRDLEGKLLTARPHVEVELTRASDRGLLSRLQQDPQVDFAIPLIRGSALLFEEAAEERAEGVELLGVGEARDLFFHKWHCEGLSGGSLWTPFSDGKAPAMVMGSELFHARYGDADWAFSASLVYPMGDVDPFGRLFPVKRRFSVAGHCESGAYLVDRKLAVVSIEEARRLLGYDEGAFSHLEIGLRDPHRVDRFLKAWRSDLAALGAVSSWKEKDRVIFSALSLERKVILGVIVLVFSLSSLTLYGILNLLALEKEGDAAVLLTLGFRPRELLRLLLFMGAVLAVIGSVLGGLLGLGAVAFLSQMPLPLPPAYYMDNLSVSQFFSVWFAVVGVSAGVQVLAALAPGLWWSRLSPATVLREIEGGIV